MDDTQRIVKCGNLSLHTPGGFFKKRWPSKYLVLYDGSKSGIKRLELFDSEIKFKKQNPAKIIPLVDCIRVVTCQRHKTTFTFEVRTSDQFYLLAAQSFQDMNDWVNCLRLVAFGQQQQQSAQTQAQASAQQSGQQQLSSLATTINSSNSSTQQQQQQQQQVATNGQPAATKQAVARDVLLDKQKVSTVASSPTTSTVTATNTTLNSNGSDHFRSSRPQLMPSARQPQGNTSPMATAIGGGSGVQKNHQSMDQVSHQPLTASQAAAAAASALAKTRQRQPSLIGACKPQPPQDSPFISHLAPAAGATASTTTGSGGSQPTSTVNAVLSAIGQVDTMTPTVRGQLISACGSMTQAVISTPVVNARAPPANLQQTAAKQQPPSQVGGRILNSSMQQTTMVKGQSLSLQPTLDEEEENMLYCSIEDNPAEHNYRVKVIETELALRCQLKCYQLTAPTTISQQYEQLGRFNPKTGTYEHTINDQPLPPIQVTFYQLIIGPQELTLLNDYATSALSARQHVANGQQQQQGLWSWPYQCIRRYGFDKDNCFMFEAGRKCTSGPGQFIVQTPKAYNIYQDVVKFVNELRSLGGTNGADIPTNNCLQPMKVAQLNSTMSPLTNSMASSSNLITTPSTTTSTSTSMLPATTTPSTITQIPVTWAPIAEPISSAGGGGGGGGSVSNSLRPTAETGKNSAATGGISDQRSKAVSKSTSPMSSSSSSSSSSVSASSSLGSSPMASSNNSSAASPTMIPPSAQQQQQQQLVANASSHDQHDKGKVTPASSQVSRSSNIEKPPLQANQINGKSMTATTQVTTQVSAKSRQKDDSIPVKKDGNGNSNTLDQETDESGYDQGDDSVDSSLRPKLPSGKSKGLSVATKQQRQATDSISSTTSWSSKSSGGSGGSNDSESPGQSVGRRSHLLSNGLNSGNPLKRPPIVTSKSNGSASKPATTLTAANNNNNNNSDNNINGKSGPVGLHNLMLDSVLGSEDFESNLIRDVYSEITKLHAKFAVTGGGSAEDSMSGSESCSSSSGNEGASSTDNHSSRSDRLVVKDLEPMYSNLSADDGQVTKPPIRTTSQGKPLHLSLSNPPPPPELDFDLEDEYYNQIVNQENNMSSGLRQPSGIGNRLMSNRFILQEQQQQQMQSRNRQGNNSYNINNNNDSHFREHQQLQDPLPRPTYPSVLNPIPECGELNTQALRTRLKSSSQNGPIITNNRQQVSTSSMSNGDVDMLIKRQQHFTNYNNIRQQQQLGNQKGNNIHQATGGSRWSNDHYLINDVQYAKISRNIHSNFG